MNAHTPCAEPGCTVTPMDAQLFRVNPVGQKGIFMCVEHAKAVDAPPREP